DRLPVFGGQVLDDLAQRASGQRRGVDAGPAGEELVGEHDAGLVVQPHGAEVDTPKGIEQELRLEGGGVCGGVAGQARTPWLWTRRRRVARSIVRVAQRCGN